MSRTVHVGRAAHSLRGESVGGERPRYRANKGADPKRLSTHEPVRSSNYTSSAAMIRLIGSTSIHILWRALGTHIRGGAQMIATRPLASLSKRLVVFSSALVVLTLVSGSGSQAQSRQALEVLNQRLLPLFELAGVVFTDADERSGRLVVGVLGRGVEGLGRGQLARLGVSSESVDLVETESIVPVATLRNKVRPVVAGLQNRFSQNLWSAGVNAILESTAGYVTAAHCSDSQGEVDG